MSPRRTSSGSIRLTINRGWWQFRRFDEPDDPVGVADGRDFRVGDDEHLVRAGDGVAEALLDPRWRVDQDEVELPAQLFAQRPHLLGRDRFLVTGLCRRDEVEVVQPLVADHGLAEPATSFHDVDDVVDDAVLQAENDVEVP